MDKQELLFSTLLKLLIEKRIFIKCNKCGKSLGLFEMGNNNCSFCGHIDYDKLLITDSEIHSSSQDV